MGLVTGKCSQGRVSGVGWLKALRTKFLTMEHFQLDVGLLWRETHLKSMDLLGPGSLDNTVDALCKLSVEVMMFHV